MYVPFGVVGVYHATICMPWAFVVALWHLEGPTTGAYIATTGVATYVPPAFLRNPSGATPGYGRNPSGPDSGTRRANYFFTGRQM